MLSVTISVGVQNFVLEEFEDLVDELLLKLNVISSSDEDQDNYEEQSPLQSAYDFSSEVDVITIQHLHILHHFISILIYTTMLLHS